MARQTKKQAAKPEPKSILDDPTVQTELLNNITLGATIKDSCGAAGLSEDTLSRYMKAHEDFADTVKKARHKAKIACVGSIRLAAKDGNWQAAAWFLERSDPETWGRTQKIILKVEPDLLKRLQAQADAANVDLASVFESMIQEFAHVDAAGNSEE